MPSSVFLQKSPVYCFSAASDARFGDVDDKQLSALTFLCIANFGKGDMLLSFSKHASSCPRITALSNRACTPPAANSRSNQIDLQR